MIDERGEQRFLFHHVHIARHSHCSLLVTATVTTTAV